MAEHGEIVWPALNAAELFTGCGGLALGLERAGFRHSFFAESDESCREILRRRFPGVPIMEDVRDVDASTPDADRGRLEERGQQNGWPERSQLEAPQRDDAHRRHAGLDLLAGGFPCQPFSAAGKRKGEQDDRYLWPEFARAIRALRPRTVLLENVPGILSMALDSGEHVFGRVLADLAEAGYVGQWFCLRASEFGAPHRRERVFVVAHAECEGSQGPQPAGRRHLPAGSGEPTADPPRNSRRIGDGDGGVVADAAVCGRRGRPPRHGANGDERTPAKRGEGDGQSAGSADVQDASDPDSSGRRALLQDDDARQPDTAWGIYEPAIRRWESRTRPAPRPTDDRGRLDPRFPEWMLGFPEGWVEGVSRTAQLRMLGNAVQVQVAEVVGAAVYRSLLERKAA